MTTIINVEVEKITPSKIDGGTVGSYGFHKLSFRFSSEWKGLGKRIVFDIPRSAPVALAITDDTAEYDIPAEVKAHAGEIPFTIEGYFEDNAIYTVSGVVVVTSSAAKPTRHPPTPSEVQQIYTYLSQAQRLYEYAFNPKGTYSDEEAYNYLDVIEYNNDIYIVKKFVKGVEPADGEYYMLAMKHGESAYEVAIRLGFFEGTEEDWNNALEKMFLDEQARVAAEAGRVAAENKRVSYEEIRKQDYAAFKTSVDTRVESMGRLQVSSEEPTDEAVDLWVDSEEEEEFAVLEASDIVQDLGEDPKKVMSQKAVTDKLNQLSEENDYLKKNTSALDSNDAELIPANSDADTYTTPGNYKVNSTTVAETIANLPENISGRLTVYESYMTNRLLQTYVTSTSVPRLYVRSYNGSKWYDWEKIITASNVAEILKNSIVSSNIFISPNNYTEYFTDYNDIPVNTVYAIGQDVPLLNSPPGNNLVDRAGETSGYMGGTVITSSGNSTAVRARFQVFFGQTSMENQSVMCFRSGYPSDGVIKWYPWQTFSDKKALTATNIAVRKEIAQDVLPDMDNAEINSIYQIDLDCDEGTILNHPNPGQSCVLITFGFSHTSRHGMVQMCFGIGGATKMFYRYGYKQSSTEYRWTAWEKVLTESSGTSDYLVNMGRLPDGSDLNNITGNVIYLVGDNAGNQNVPTEEAGFITSKNVKNITLHTYETLTGGRYSRYAVGDEWHEWVKG